MTKRALLVVHQERSDPGRIGRALRERGYELDLRRPALGQALPEDMRAHDVAVIFGGPMSANDDLDFIREETEWIGTALASGKPFLGVCLGGQMLAKRLGADVRPHAEGLVEVGYVPIRPTADGADLFPDPLHVYQWHREGFDIPDGAVRLAGSDVYPNQAYRYEAAIGIQFHPEVTPLIMHRWLVRAADRLDLPGAQPRLAQLAQRPVHDPVLRQWLETFIDHWIGLDSGRRGRKAAG